MQTLESLRESKGVTKVAIANYLGVSRPTYDEYEDSPHKMRVETALAVAEFLGVDVNEIFSPHAGIKLLLITWPQAETIGRAVGDGTRCRGHREIRPGGRRANLLP